MGNLYKRLAELCEEHGITGYKMCKDVGIQPSVMTDLKMGRRASVKAETANRLATYFGVSVGYLLGENSLVVRAERWESNKAARLYMCIDSALLDTLERMAKLDGISLEDEVEKILHEGTEERIENEEADKFAQAQRNAEPYQTPSGAPEAPPEG